MTPLPAASPSALTTMGAPCCGDAELPAKVLCVAFRAFQLRCGAGRAEGSDAGRREIVDNARHQRRLRADDHEIDAMFAASHDDGGGIGERKRQQRRQRFAAGIAGRDKKSFERGRLRDGAGQRVLPGARSQDQYIHAMRPRFSFPARRFAPTAL